MALAEVVWIEPWSGPPAVCPDAALVVTCVSWCCPGASVSRGRGRGRSVFILSAAVLFPSQESEVSFSSLFCVVLPRPFHKPGSLSLFDFQLCLCWFLTLRALCFYVVEYSVFLLLFPWCCVVV